MKKNTKTIALAGLAALALSAGCRGYGPTVQEGMDYYEDGDFKAALAKLEVSEGPIEHSGVFQPVNDRTIVRYFVYRGLTHYHLGERADTLKYLTRGSDLYQKGERIWLPRKVAAEMGAALDELRKGPQ